MDFRRAAFLGGWTALLMFGAGCQNVPPAKTSTLVFARLDAARTTYHERRVDLDPAGLALNFGAAVGELRIAARAGVAAATISRTDGHGGELRQFSWPLQDSTSHLLASEWAWDFAVNPDDGAIVWIAGREQRELFVARPPSWTPSVIPLPKEMEPAGPRWLGADLALSVRRGGRAEIVVWHRDGVLSSALHLAESGRGLEIVAVLPGQRALLVVESNPEPKAGRLLRVPLDGGSAKELVTGFFLSTGVVVSADERFIGAVWSEQPADVLARRAPLRWIGERPPNLPAEIPEATAAAWSPDGRYLAVARSNVDRRDIELYSLERAGIAPRWVGFTDAPSVAPQWVAP